MQILLFAGGLAALLIGAELLVRGASDLAVAFGLSPLVVGLTVVAFGTSSPELAVSVAGAWTGNSELAVGNVVGSNVFNVLFILGLSAVITPLVVQRQIVRLEGPILLVISILAGAMCLDGSVGRVDGIVLSVLLIISVYFTVTRSRRESRALAESGTAQTDESDDAGGGGTRRALGWNVLFVVAGLGLLVLGSDWLVDSAVVFARRLGISETVVALTVISAGTSLPEVATSVTAAIRGERDIAVGNVVGSNLFNLLGVLGASATIAPAALELTEAALVFDIPVMIGVSALVLPIFFTGHRIDRWEGGLLLAYYVAYVTFLILRATGSLQLERFTTAVVWFVIPMTVVTLAIFVIRQLRSAQDGGMA